MQRADMPGICCWTSLEPQEREGYRFPDWRGFEALFSDFVVDCCIGIRNKRSMTQVVVGENEGIESALRRFKRQVSKAGIFSEVKRRRHFETPQEKRKRKAVARRKKRYR